METSSSYLKAVRDAHGLTQDGLSKLTGMSQSEISRLERGQDLPTLAQAVALARAMPGGGSIAPLDARHLVALALADEQATATDAA